MPSLLDQLAFKALLAKGPALEDWGSYGLVAPGDGAWPAVSCLFVLSLGSPAAM